MRHALASLLLLTACVRVPGPKRELNPIEQQAIASAWQAYEAHRGELAECPVWEPDRVRLILLPYETLQEECMRRYLERRFGLCNQETPACSFGVNEHVFDIPPRGWVLVDDSLDAPTILNALVHESLHGLRGCDLLMPDRLHEDDELWGVIQSEALAGLRVGQ